MARRVQDTAYISSRFRLERVLNSLETRQKDYTGAFLSGSLVDYHLFSNISTARVLSWRPKRKITMRGQMSSAAAMGWAAWELRGAGIVRDMRVLLASLT